MSRCVYCEESSPPVPKGHEAHRSCAQAWSLDFDPKSDAEARVWLDRRRCQFKQRRRWTIGLPRTTLLMGPLKVATEAYLRLRAAAVPS